MEYEKKRSVLSRLRHALMFNLQKKDWAPMLIKMRKVNLPMSKGVINLGRYKFLRQT